MADQRDQETGNDQKHLETRYVFVDTATYRSLRYNWDDSRLKKLREHASKTTIQLLITDVTKREVRRQIQGLVQDALEHVTTLHHIGVDVTILKDAAAAAARGLAKFEDFLHEAEAVTVPLSADLDRLVEDFFELRPPFSKKKQQEWRDAIVCASLLSFARASEGRRIYVVSEDPDLQAFCSAHQEMVFTKSLANVVSRANDIVSVYALVRDKLGDCAALQSSISKLFVGRPVRLVFDYEQRDYAPGGKILEAEWEQLNDIYVIDHTGNRFECEIQFEMNLQLEVDIQEPGSYAYHSRKETVVGQVALVNVEFDPARPEFLRIERITIDEDGIEIEAANLA